MFERFKKRMENNSLNEQSKKRSFKIRNEIDVLVKEFCDLKYASEEFNPLHDTVPVSGKVIGYKEISNMVASFIRWMAHNRKVLMMLLRESLAISSI